MTALAAASFTVRCGGFAPSASPLRTSGERQQHEHAPAASFGAAGSPVLDAGSMRTLMENYAPTMHLAGVDMPACKNCHSVVGSGEPQVQAARIVAAL